MPRHVHTMRDYRYPPEERCKSFIVKDDKPYCMALTELTCALEGRCSFYKLDKLKERARSVQQHESGDK